jgi:hypothetical protein
MNGIDFYTLAVTLSGNPQPADQRSAISRAYYGAFHISYEFLRDLGISMPRGPEAHDKVWKVLSGSDDVDVKTIAAMGSSLRAARNDADYHLSNASAQARATVVINLKRAHDIIECIGQCCLGGPKAASREVIRQYAARIFRLPIN